MNRTIMLIMKTTAEKNMFETFILPKQWKMRQLCEAGESELSLTRAQRDWLDNHEQSHGSREFLAVIRGTALLRVDGRPIRLNQGEFLAIEPWVLHTVGHLPDESAIYWWCMLEPGRFNMLLWRQNRIDSYQIMEAGNFVRILDETLSGSRDPATVTELEHFAAGLICRFFRMRKSDEKLHQEKVVQKVLAWLEDTAVLKCSLTTAASLAGYSRTHFQRLFRQYTGETFYDYLQRKRLERYHALRRKSTTTKKEMAYLLGFTSTAALNHWEHEIRTEKSGQTLDRKKQPKNKSDTAFKSCRRAAADSFLLESSSGAAIQPIRLR